MKWIGAVLIILTSAAVGFRMCIFYKRQQQQLEQLLQTFHFMKCELQYRLTPLPDQIHQCALLTGSAVGRFYQTLYEELNAQISPNAQCCLKAAIEKSDDLAPISKRVLKYLGNTLGCFDLEGQLVGVADAEQLCQEELARLKKEKPNRIRNYQTLSLCAGAALVIVLI